MIEILLVEKIYCYLELVLFYEIVVFAKGIEFPNLVHKENSIEQKKNIDTTFSDTLMTMATPIGILVIGVVAIYKYFTQSH